MHTNCENLYVMSFLVYKYIWRLSEWNEISGRILCVAGEVAMWTGYIGMALVHKDKEQASRAHIY